MDSRYEHKISLCVRASRQQTIDISSNDVQLYDRVFWDMTGVCHVSFADLQHTQTALASLQQLIVHEQPRVGEKWMFYLLAVH
jgi:hypothetical protein